MRAIQRSIPCLNILLKLTLTQCIAQACSVLPKSTVVSQPKAAKYPSGRRHWPNHHPSDYRLAGVHGQITKPPQYNLRSMAGHMQREADKRVSSFEAFRNNRQRKALAEFRPKEVLAQSCMQATIDVMLLGCSGRTYVRGSRALPCT